MTSSRIGPATFSPVAQCLSQLRYRVPLLLPQWVTQTGGLKSPLAPSMSLKDTDVSGKPFRPHSSLGCPPSHGFPKPLSRQPVGALAWGISICDPFSSFFLLSSTAPDSLDPVTGQRLKDADNRQPPEGSRYSYYKNNFGFSLGDGRMDGQSDTVLPRQARPIM
jgi:hypothetical protein